MLRPVYSHQSLIPALSAAILLSGSVLDARSVSAGEMFNEFDTSPSGTFDPTSFSVSFHGDLIHRIGSQNAADALIDPFANPADLAPGGNPSNASISSPIYNATLNETTVTYSGSPLKADTRMHFGLDGFPSLSNAVIAGKSWNYGSSAPPVEMPAGSPILSQPHPIAGNPTEYIVIFFETAFSRSGIYSGSWFEMPFVEGPNASVAWNPLERVLEVDGFGDANGGADIAFTDGESLQLYLEDYRFMISPTLIPLDNLNLAGLPPTDPLFTPFNGPSHLPEPASLSLLATAVLGLAGFRRFIRRR